MKRVIYIWFKKYIIYKDSDENYEENREENEVDSPSIFFKIKNITQKIKNMTSKL